MHFEKDPFTKKILETPLQYTHLEFKQLGSTTLEWIKTQPYFLRVIRLDENVGADIETKFSINFLNLVGQETDNKDQVHLLLRKFQVLESIFTNDFLDSFVHYELLYNKNCSFYYEQYIKCGMEMPQVILPNRSILLKNVENGEELYKGHFVIWNEILIKPQEKFMNFFIVFVIDEKCKQDF